MIESFWYRLDQIKVKETKNNASGPNASLYLLQLFFLFLLFKLLTLTKRMVINHGYFSL